MICTKMAMLNVMCPACTAPRIRNKTLIVTLDSPPLIYDPTSLVPPHLDHWTSPLFTVFCLSHGLNGIK